MQGMNDYQYHWEVYLRYLVPKFYEESKTMMLVISP